MSNITPNRTPGLTAAASGPASLRYRARTPRPMPVVTVQAEVRDGFSRDDDLDAIARLIEDYAYRWQEKPDRIARLALARVRVGNPR